MIQLPQDFCRHTIAAIGEDEFQRLAAALSQTAPTSVRLNPAKCTEADVAAMLDGAERVGWCYNAFHLAARPQFTFDPLLHAGCYYVQEASSMYVGKIISEWTAALGTPVVALDACAAPGGKSTLALDSMPAGSLLVANEYVRQRAHILTENLMKWGSADVIVTNSDTRDFSALNSLFDIVVCDAPCSGEGMFRKDPKAIDEWSLGNVAACQDRQRHIVGNLWPSLRQGGLMVYSTCTFNRAENEDNVAWIERTFGARLLEMKHFYPHESKGEGFFVAAFEKEDEEDTLKPGKKKKQEKLPKAPAELTAWLNDPGRFALAQSPGGAWHAFPIIYNNVLERVSAHARVVHHGIQLAEPKGKQLQPCHNLALSRDISPTAFPTADLDHTSAIAYLRCEAIALPPGTPKGIVLVTHKRHPLGFVKNVGNRANNLYPQEWRIRSQFPCTT